MTLKETNYHFRDQPVTTPGHDLQCHCEECQVPCKMCAMAMKEREYMARMSGIPFSPPEEFRECVDNYHRKVQFGTSPRAVKLRLKHGISEPEK